MPDTDSSNAQPGEKLYTIGTVARLTGVGAITLRAWERRYELIQPVRKQSGHRLYTRRHIDLINRITALTAQGMRISQIQPEMLEAATATDRDDAANENVWRNYLDNMISAVIEFDESRLEHIYNDVLSLHPIELVTRNLLKPLLVELGLRWETEKGSIAEEHFFAFYLRNKLGARFHHRSRQHDGPRLLIAGLPGEFHEIALLLFALAANERGYQLLILGANMPFQELPAVASKAACDAIVLSGAMEPTNGVLGKGLRQLVKQSDVPVFVGGQVSVSACNLIHRAGAVALGHDLETGLQTMRDQLTDNAS